MNRFRWMFCCMVLSSFYLGASLFSPVQAGPSSAPLTLYTNAGEQVSYQFPANWPVTEMDQQGKGYIVRMAAIRPSAGDNDPFTENINLVVEDIGPTMTLAQYFEANRKNMPSGLKEFKEEKSGNLRTANANGMYMIYSHHYPGVDPRLKVLVFIFTKAQKGYVLTCTSTTGSFAKYQDLFMTIGKSFKFDF